MKQATFGPIIVVRPGAIPSASSLKIALDSFVAGLIKIVAQKKEYQRKQEEEERLRREMARQREEQQKAHAELERKIRQEQARVNKLITDAENYKKSKLIRDFIAAVQNEQQKGKSVYVPAEAYNEWIEWARDQADRLDPLAVSPASIIDSATKEDGEDRNKW